MIARARINRQVRMIALICLPCFAVFAIGMFIANPGPNQFPVIPIVALAIAWLTVMGTFVIGIRCPFCRGRLTQLVFHSGFFGVSPRVRFCPYCGTNLDEDDSAAESTQS